MSRNIEQAAIELVEQMLGTSIGTWTGVENVRLNKGFGRLSRNPVREIHTVMAAYSNHPFKPFGSMTDNISIKDGVIWGADGRIFVRPSMFSTDYEKAIVSYTSGDSEIPSDLDFVIREVASLIEQGKLDEYSGRIYLSEESLEIIENYRDRRRR